MTLLGSAQAVNSTGGGMLIKTASTYESRWFKKTIHTCQQQLDAAYQVTNELLSTLDNALVYIWPIQRKSFQWGFFDVIYRGIEGGNCITRHFHHWGVD